MSISALNSSATGLQALSNKLDVIANNLANVDTVAFKRSRVNFEDLLYQVRRQPGTENADGDPTPNGIEVGTGVQLSSTQLNFEQGGLDLTDRPLDMAVQGIGFFQVTVPESLSPDGTAYTRAGNFVINANGELVLGNRNGFKLEPPISIPEDYTSITIGSDGRVFVTTPGSTEPEEQGQMQLARFINSEGLLAVGQNVFIETAASGAPIEGTPNEEGFGGIVQGSLELSNVEPVEELVDLIQTQRAFELNSQTIEASNEMLRVVSNLRQ